MIALIRHYGSTLFLAISILLGLLAVVTAQIKIVAVALLLAPALGVWASIKLWRWYRFYGTRFLWGLFLASLAADLASLPIAWLSWLSLTGQPAPGAGHWVGMTLLILEGVFVYLVLRWQDLDLDMKRERVGFEDESFGTNIPPQEEDRS